MELTILLAKVIGTYMVIGGIALLVRKRFFMSGLTSFIEDKATRFLLSAIDLLVGLLIVNTHNDWSTLPAGLITLIGWITIVKGVVSMYAKDTTLEKLSTKFRQKKWYLPEAIIVIVIGLYLTAFGFGWF